MAEAKYNSREHKQRRQQYGAAIKAGQGWCVEPICVMASRYIPPDAPWDVPHNEDGITYRDGPAHARCNRADGGRRRHLSTTVATGPSTTHRGTLAKRECVVCSAIYTPSYSKQAACGRACGEAMKRMGIAPTPQYAKLHKPCASCGIHFPHDGTPRKYCESCRPGVHTPTHSQPTQPPGSRWAL